MAAVSAPRRFAVFAHFDPDGEVAPHVRRTIAALTDFVDRLVVVSTAPLTADSREWLSGRSEFLERPNSGHDFASYVAGMAHLEEDPDQLILMNDSAVMPLYSLPEIFAAMETRNQDAWGLTPGYGFGAHLQSYMLVFDRQVLESPTFRQFWDFDPLGMGREELIIRYEVGLARALRDSGFRLDTYFRPTFLELIRGACRAHAAELERALNGRKLRSVAGWYRRLPRRVLHPEWNPAVALADITLRRPDRLPAVKISTLRDDAYRLDALSLLRALEQSQPEHFDGVEAYLARTDHAYGGRWSTTVNAPSRRLHYLRR